MHNIVGIVIQFYNNLLIIIIILILNHKLVLSPPKEMCPICAYDYYNNIIVK